MRKAQGSLEYLLLVAGAVLVATIILLLVLGATPIGKYILGNNLEIYQNRITLNGGSSGGGQSGDTTPPDITLFQAVGGDFKMDLSYDTSDNVGVASIIAVRSKNSIDSGNFPLAYFDSPPPGVVAATLFSGNQSAVNSTFLDEAVSNGYRYYYGIRSCDASGNCSASFSGIVSPVGPAFTITFSPNPPEKVFAYNFIPGVPTKCGVTDTPDSPPRAFRDRNDKIVLYAVNAPDNYAMVSTNAYDFTATNFVRQCAAPSVTSPTPSSSPPLQSYYSQRWMAAPYTEDGKNVYAILYDEYHDPYYGSPCTWGSYTNNPCMYTSLDLAISNDKGLTFFQNAPNNPPANHVIASVSAGWDPLLSNPAPPVYGVLLPTNIVKRAGYYYSTVNVIRQPNLASSHGSCLMRTNKLAVPSSWEFYDGSLLIGPEASWFNASIFNVKNSPLVNHTECGFTDLPSNYITSGSLSYNTFMQRYLLVAMGPNTGNCHFYYSTSKDLIHWSKPLVFKDTPDGPQCSLFKDAQIYPAVIDHTDTSRNFENSGPSAWLYYVVSNSSTNAYDRDLERVQFTIT